MSACSVYASRVYASSEWTHSYSATPTDNARNPGSGSTSFTVSLSPSSLQPLITGFSTDPGVADLLQQDVTNNATAPNTNAKAGVLRGFRHLVRAQMSKSLTSAQANGLYARRAVQDPPGARG